MEAEKIILGRNHVYSTDSNVTQLNNNVIVCGGSGSGKTMSIAEPLLLETFNNSKIITLSKRRLVNKYTKLFEERGYKVLDMNFVNPEESTVGYNPLDYIKSTNDITFLAESIVMCDPRKKGSSADPYWDHAAISLFSAEIAYIMSTKEKPNLADVIDFHTSIEFDESGGVIKTNVDIDFKVLKFWGIDKFATSCWKSFKQLPIKTASCVFSTLNTILDSIFTPELRKMMSMENALNFEEIANEKTLLFITTSAVNPVLHNYINIFYSHVFKELFEYAEKRPDGQLPIPVQVLCDDFAVGSVIHNFAEYISIFREKRMSAILLLQSESQLESMYGVNDAMTIINNCDSYVYMGGMDSKTARHLGEKVNLPTDEVLALPIGKEILLRRGQKPVIIDRYDILADSRYQEITKRYEDEIKKSERM